MTAPLFVVLAALLAAAPPAEPTGRAAASKAGAPATPSEREFQDMTSGRYDVGVSGLLCSVCTRAILAELERVDDIASTKADLAQEKLTIVVKPKHLLKLRTLRRALRRAARAADLDTRYEVVSIRYRP